MLTRAQRAAARRGHCRDLAGWSPVDDGDVRTPVGVEGWRRGGPWVADGRPAHGLYERPHVSGMVDWAAAYHGWMLWRWRGPRMNWSSPLVSPWNPILAQNLTLEELDGSGVYWPEQVEEWIAAAILGGRKTGGGFFELRPRRRMRAWVRHARAAGIEVELRRGCWADAAESGTLGERFDLPGLAAEYARVLPGEMGEHAARDVLQHAGVRLIRAAIIGRESYPAPVRGLALGYPPEVTAGLLVSREHRREHPPERAEFGAYCPRCERAGARAEGPGVGEVGRGARGWSVMGGGFSVPRGVRARPRRMG